MTDREMLELAAKAAGYEIRIVDYGGGRFEARRHTQNNVWTSWDPRCDDGDAVRLMVKLNLPVEIDAESAGVVVVEWQFDQGGISAGCVEQPSPVGSGDCATTRLAITRAAAEVGRNMP